MRISIISTLISMIILCSCSSDNKQESSEKQTIKIFKTGCYPISQDSTKPGLHCQVDGMYYHLDTIPVINLFDFKEVSVSKSTGKFLVNIILTDVGEQKFTNATEKYIGKSLGFVINNKLVMNPKINEKITGNSIMIDGNFNEEEMINCFQKIKSAMDAK